MELLIKETQDVDVEEKKKIPSELGVSSLKMG